MSLSAKELCIADALQRIDEAQVRLRRTEEDLEKARGVLSLLLREAQLTRPGGYVRLTGEGKPSPNPTPDKKETTK
ncbi:MAG: hypothetical protein IJV65_07535 [Kiritimatiellae bacterium]|nr:hypothetical protein [Kiritimatiellia bacterium]